MERTSYCRISAPGGASTTPRSSGMASTYELVIDALTNPGGADPERGDVDCSQDWFPGAEPSKAQPGPEGPVDRHITDEEPPLMPYAQGA